MNRTEKAETVSGIRERFDRMTSAVFLDPTGMTVEEVTKLRDSAIVSKPPGSANRCIITALASTRSWLTDLLQFLCTG